MIDLTWNRPKKILFEQFIKEGVNFVKWMPNHIVYDKFSLYPIYNYFDLKLSYWHETCNFFSLIFIDVLK